MPCRLPVLALVALVFAVSCTPDRPVTPGLLIGPGGSILKADPEHVRTARTHQLRKLAESLLGPGWQAEFSIAELPYSFEPEVYTWKSMTLTAVISAPASGEPQTDLPAVARAVRARAGRWIDDRRAPVLTVELHRRPAALPTPSASAAAP